jgi:LCP family protein required for cell wall assembly
MRGVMTAPRQPRRAWLATLLSFCFPGLGQAYAGDWAVAALLATPVLLLVLGIASIVVLSPGSITEQVFSTNFLIGLFVLNLALLAWRIFAVVHAGASNMLPAGSPDHGHFSVRTHRRLTLAAIGVAVLATFGMHFYVALVVDRFNTTLGAVFDEDDDPGGGLIGNIPLPSDATPVPEPAEGRTNFLLIGVDSAPGRDSSLTDTILVVSVDARDESAVMVSIPRDTGFAPLPDTTIYPDGIYPRKINELAAEAERSPELWCPGMTIATEADAVACGVRTLSRTVSLYLGIPIQYHARIDLVGFERLIDALGGVELCLPGRLVDPRYTDDRRQQVGLILEAGCRRYDGPGALAYARSRQGWIEMPDGTTVAQTDFDRAERQQEVLVAIRDELDSGDLIFELPSVLDAVSSTVDTDFPRSRAPDLANLVPLIAGPSIERVVLGYPDYVDLPVDPQANYVLTPKRENIREEMEDLFATRDDPLEGWYVGGEDETPTP